MKQWSLKIMNNDLTLNDYCFQQNENFNDATSSSHKPCSDSEYDSIDLEKISTEYIVTSGPHDSTIDYFQTFSYNYNIFRKLSPMPSFDSVSKEVRFHLSSFLSAFHRVFILNRISIEQAGYLPPLKLKFNDDGSVLIEWIFRDYRVGFSIEPILDESSWYLVSNKNLEELSSSGDLKAKEFESIISSLLPFVLMNT